MDLDDFRRACRKVADRTRGKVIEFRFSHGVTPNFHQGVIAYRDGPRVSVVGVRDSDVLAVAEPRELAGRGVNTAPLTFGEAPELEAVLADLPRFRALTKSEVDGPFDAAAWPEVLRYDIECWRPETLGEALFNFWD